MEGAYTLYIYRVGKESPKSRYKCLVDIESNSDKLHQIKSYSNLPYYQKEKAKHIVETFRGEESKLLKKLNNVTKETD